MAARFTPQHQKLTLVVDLDERGWFKAHVENINGKCIFAFSNEDDHGWPDPDGLWLVECGFMAHGTDRQGLLRYMQSAGLATANATLD